MNIKIRLADPEKAVFDTIILTQPNQSFTPRQILEQFARNEIIPSMNEPSDSINDENFTEEQMENVITFEDEFEAAQHLIDNQYRLKQDETNQEQPSVLQGSEEPSKEA